MKTVSSCISILTVDKLDALAELGGNKKIPRMRQKSPITVSADRDTAAVIRSRRQQRASRSDIAADHGARSDTSSQAEPNLSMDHLMIIKASMTGEFHRVKIKSSSFSFFQTHGSRFSFGCIEAPLLIR